MKEKEQNLPGGLGGIVTRKWPNVEKKIA